MYTNEIPHNDLLRFRLRSKQTIRSATFHTHWLMYIITPTRQMQCVTPRMSTHSLTKSLTVTPTLVIRSAFPTDVLIPETQLVGTTLRTLKTLPVGTSLIWELVEVEACQPVNSNFRSVRRNPHYSSVSSRIDRYTQESVQPVALRLLAPSVPRITNRIRYAGTYALTLILIS